MSKRYKEIVFKGETIIASKGKRLKISKNEYGKPELQIVPKKKKPDVFFRITASKREKVKNWLIEQKLETERTQKENSFLRVLAEALEEVDYEYEIATIEPTVVDGKIAYIKGKDVAIGYSSNSWIKMAEEYLPERGSRVATLYELFIWYAWRIVKGYWTLHYVAEDSSGVGSLYNSLNPKLKLEPAGTIKCGGFKDGQGNSYKLVTYKKSLHAVGGNFHFVYRNPSVSDFKYVGNDYYFQHYSVGVVVLTK